MQQIIDFLKTKSLPEDGMYLVFDIVVAYVSKYHNFPTVRRIGEIYDAIHPGKISTATIFRYLQSLEERNYLTKVHNTYLIRGGEWSYYGEELPRLDR